ATKRRRAQVAPREGAVREQGLLPAATASATGAKRRRPVPKTASPPPNAATRYANRARTSTIVLKTAVAAGTDIATGEQASRPRTAASTAFAQGTTIAWDNTAAAGPAPALRALPWA